MITMNVTVNDVMTTTVVAVKQGASYKEMAALLRKYRVSAFPVLDDDQRVIGIVSEADLLAKAALNADRGGAITAMVHHKELKKADGVTAGDLMTSNVVTVKPDDTVEQAARLMYHLQVKRLPVVDAGGYLVGIVSRADLLRALAARIAQPAAGGDGRIRDAILAELRAQPWGGNPADQQVMVQDGVVHLWGTVTSEVQRQARIAAAEATDGVKRVEDHMDKWTQPDPMDRPNWPSAGRP